MSLTRCGQVIKYTLFCFNMIMLMAGAGLVAFGSFTRTNKIQVLRLFSIILDEVFISIPWIFIVAGVTAFVISFIGCCGAIQKARGMLTLYFVLLFILLLGFVASGIVGYEYRFKIESLTLEQLRNSLKSSYGRETDVTESWDVLQYKLQCCGIQGNINHTESWAFFKFNTSWFAKQSPSASIRYVPDSCCRYPSNEINRTQCVHGKNRLTQPVKGPPVNHQQFNDQLFSQGCFTVICNLLERNIWVFMVAITAMTSLMLIGMICSVCLCKRIEEQYLDDEEDQFEEFVIS